MLLIEIFEPILEKQIWARSGKRVVRKYRCTGGRRHGRIVSKMSQCYAPLNVRKSVTLKKTKQRVGGKMTRKAMRTKRVNPASLRLRNLNR
jgi:hypothetical protein